MAEEAHWLVTSLVIAFLICAGAIGWAWYGERREDARRRDESEKKETKE